MPSQDEPPPIDLDAAVVKSLAKLADGQIIPFADQEPPPAQIEQWIANANRPQTHGALSLTLYRWHELKSRGE